MDGNRYEYGDHLKVPADQKAWIEWKVLEKGSRNFSPVSGNPVSFLKPMTTWKSWRN